VPSGVTSNPDEGPDDALSAIADLIVSLDDEARAELIAGLPKEERVAVARLLIARRREE